MPALCASAPALPRPCLHALGLPRRYQSACPCICAPAPLSHTPPRCPPCARPRRVPCHGDALGLQLCHRPALPGGCVRLWRVHSLPVLRGSLLRLRGFCGQGGGGDQRPQVGPEGGLWMGGVFGCNGCRQGVLLLGARCRKPITRPGIAHTALHSTHSIGHPSHVRTHPSVQTHAHPPTHPLCAKPPRNRAGHGCGVTQQTLCPANLVYAAQLLDCQHGRLRQLERSLPEGWQR